MIDPAFLELLACPNCQDSPPLRLDQTQLVCTVCGRRYPICDGLPDLLPESAIEPEPSTPTHD